MDFSDDPNFSKTLDYTLSYEDMDYTVEDFVVIGSALAEGDGASDFVVAVGSTCGACRRCWTTRAATAVLGTHEACAGRTTARPSSEKQTVWCRQWVDLGRVQLARYSRSAKRAASDA